MRKLFILKTLVGSNAHGLATESSDLDYRGVYITPTSDLLKLNGGAYKGVHWIEADEDDTAYELGHFLQLATKSNPTILEVFKAPIVNIDIDLESSGFNDDYGMYIKKNLIFFREELRDLFPYVWSSKCVYDSFKGYSHNQHKKMFDEKEEFAKRRFKYAVAHLRVLLQGIELLATGDFSVEIRDTYPYVGVPSPIISKHITSSWRAFLMLVKNQQVDVGDVVSVSEYLKTALLEAYNNCPNKEVNIEPINKFLLEVRRVVW